MLYRVEDIVDREEQGGLNNAPTAFTEGGYYNRDRPVVRGHGYSVARVKARADA